MIKQHKIQFGFKQEHRYECSYLDSLNIIYSTSIRHYVYNLYIYHFIGQIHTKSVFDLSNICGIVSDTKFKFYPRQHQDQILCLYQTSHNLAIFVLELKKKQILFRYQLDIGYHNSLLIDSTQQKFRQLYQFNKGSTELKVVAFDENVKISDQIFANCLTNQQLINLDNCSILQLSSLQNKHSYYKLPLSVADSLPLFKSNQHNTFHILMINQKPLKIYITYFHCPRQTSILYETNQKHHFIQILNERLIIAHSFNRYLCLQMKPKQKIIRRVLITKIIQTQNWRILCNNSDNHKIIFDVRTAKNIELSSKNDYEFIGENNLIEKMIDIGYLTLYKFK